MSGESNAPEGWSTVTPRIVCADTRALLGFLQEVFGAAGTYEAERPTVVTIGDSRIMVSTTDQRDLTAAFLYVYVDSADDVFQRAIARGATALEEPVDVHYGERRCMFDDPWGNTWQVAHLL